MKRIYKKEEKELYIFKLVLSSIMSLCSLIFNMFLKELAKITSHHKNRNIYDICQYQYMYMYIYMYAYCVYPVMSKSPKQLPNCLKSAAVSYRRAT